MEKTLEFPVVLRLLDERSDAFVAAVAAAPSLDVPVPTCPGWTLFDLAQHVGRGRRKWAAIVAAGPADAPPAEAAQAAALTAPREREALTAWLTASIAELRDALRAAGPDRGCWTWWARSESPQTCGVVARHQLQEVAVHTYDAQSSLNAPQPLPEEVGLDGVDEFLATCCAGDYSWPHEPATVDYQATEGRSWRLSLAADGTRLTRLHTLAGETPAVADASARGPAGELVLFLYGRIPLDSLKADGDRSLFDRLVEWDPS